METLHEVLLIIATAVAAFLAKKIVELLDAGLNKIGFDLDASKEEKARAFIANKILEVEEKFLYDSEFVKSAGGKVVKLFGAVDPAKAKLAAVLSEVLAKLPGLDKEEAIAIIHQELPKLAELGIGGLGKQIVQAMQVENYRPSND